MRVRMILPLALLALSTGCVLPDNVVVNLPDDEGKTGQVVVSNASGNTELTRPLAAVGLEAGTPPGRAFITDQQAVKTVFKKVLEATPRQPVSVALYFEPGTAQVAPASMRDLARALDAAKTMGYPEITVIHHDDPASPLGQNDPLIMARAESVAAQFISAGVSRSAVEIENYGSAVAHLEGFAGPERSPPIEVVIR